MAKREETPNSTTLNSTTSLPIALRLRPDLKTFRQQFGGRLYWGIKDPVSLNYFQFRDEEYAIVRMLDGRVSLDEIKHRFEQMFAPHHLSIGHIQEFLGDLFRKGLLLDERPGQGDLLLSRRLGRQRRERTGAMTNLLAIRFRGIDPERLLGWLYPKCSWIFSVWCVIGTLLLAVLALSLVFVQFDVLQSQLPAFHAFFNLKNALWIALALGFVKVLHELGHGLACKHFGGECHEMGIMFLVFTPCLYCNVSDAWTLRNKWQRVAISAAGIYVEVFLASVCTFLWWYSEPGLMNTLFLNTMFVCSISTIVFNGNPLLRYDGYFILADILEIPNLRQQSSDRLKRFLGKLCLGIDSGRGSDFSESNRKVLLPYAVASWVYRWFIVAAILWFLMQTLKPYRLEILGQGFATFVVFGLLIAPILGTVAVLKDSTRRRQLKRWRVALFAVIVVGFASAIALIPLPYSIAVPAVIEPGEARRVYVFVPGRLTKVIPYGSKVKQGKTLAELANLDVEFEVGQLLGQRNQLKLHLQNLEARRIDAPELSSQIPAARESLADLEERLKKRQDDQRRLVLVAPISGTVLPPPALPRPQHSQHQLSAWTGTPLENRNLDSFLERGTLFCLIGDPKKLEAVLLIDQSEVQFVQKGQKVRILLDQSAGRVIEGSITAIAREYLESPPLELAQSGDLPAVSLKDGSTRPVETYFQAKVLLEKHDLQLVIGAQGRAKIRVGSQTLGQRIHRYLSRTFNFRI